MTVLVVAVSMCLKLSMAPARTRQRPWSWTGLTLTVAAAALWGLAPVATKAALAGFSPELIGLLRLAVSAVLFRLLGGGGGPLLVADAWLWLGGVALGVDFILYNYGLQWTSAGVSGLVVNVEVVSTIALAVWWLGEQLGPRRVVGCGVTLLGVALVNLDAVHLQDLAIGGHALGNIMVMLAGISWSVFAVAQRRSHDNGNLFHRLATIFAVAALTVAPTLLHRGAWMAAGGTVPLVMLVVLTVLCTGLVYFLYARAQELLDVSVLAVLLCSIPVFAVAFAYVLLGEPLTWSLVFGGVVVVAGIVVIASETTQGVEAPEALAEPAHVAHEPPPGVVSERAP